MLDPETGAAARRVLGLLGALVIGACVAAPGAPAPSPSPTEPVTTAIVAELDASAEAWNRGELDGFVAPYLVSDQTTFVGSRGVTRGHAAVRSAFERAYWKDGQRPEGALRFSEVEVRPLGERHALAVGRYTLTDRRDGRQTATGIFSLVWVRTDAGWRILHDHSS